ncbi:MAG TPA: TM2 domain-containing protein [Bacteroidota bacterium]|nr:TM2 domain-containing protein [Bacteroidota bacterium]
MDQSKVDLFMMTYSKYFEGHHLMAIRDQLLKLDDSKMIQIQSVNMKDPTMVLIVSIIGGHFGIDRFIIGDTGVGVAKLLTCGGLGIWTIVDWFMIMGRTRQVNMERIQMYMH